MSAEELMEAFSKVKLEAEKVMEANEEVEIFTDESELEATAKADINAEVKRTTEDCEQKLEEVEDVVQKVLWQSFGCAELALALEAAEKDCKRLTGRKSDLRLEVYELMLSNLERLVKRTKDTMRQWTRWVPDEERPDFQQRIRNVEGSLLELTSEKAGLLQTKLDSKSSEKTSQQSPTIKLKPTALPQFGGNKRNFYLWRREWEALQRQGEPTGSKEVKKIQLLGSLEDKVARDLRLSI